jgi:hypothetical protein
MDHIQASRIDPEHGNEETDKERKRGSNKIRNAAVAAANEVKAATFRTSLGQNLARTRRAKRLKIERAEGGVSVSKPQKLINVVFHGRVD